MSPLQHKARTARASGADWSGQLSLKAGGTWRIYGRKLTACQSHFGPARSESCRAGFFRVSRFRTLHRSYV